MPRASVWLAGVALVVDRERHDAGCGVVGVRRTCGRPGVRVAPPGRGAQRAVVATPPLEGNRPAAADCTGVSRGACARARTNAVKTTVIVAAAIVVGNPPRVLAAQRSYPPELAGLWELPGGKVHDGERDLDALVRECREELGVDVRPMSRLGDDVAISEQSMLRAWWAEP